VRPTKRSDDLAIDAPIDHRDVTPIMGLPGDMQHDIRPAFENRWKTNLAKEAEDPEDA
jgi:hypothetical protein